jgi:hypothetical protein
MAAEHPELYRELAVFYCVDSAGWRYWSGEKGAGS